MHVAGPPRSLGGAPRVLIVEERPNKRAPTLERPRNATSRVPCLSGGRRGEYRRLGAKCRPPRRGNSSRRIVELEQVSNSFLRRRGAASSGASRRRRRPRARGARHPRRAPVDQSARVSQYLIAHTTVYSRYRMLSIFRISIILVRYSINNLPI